MDLPPQFARNVTNAFPTGARWLKALPGMLADVSARWNLTLGPPFLLSFNYVAPATRADGSEVVLKLGVPHGELMSELAATRLYGGQGMVRLLDADPARGALLLERLRPGTMLADWFDPDHPDGGRDDEATAIAGQIMRDLWRPVPPAIVSEFVTLSDWLGNADPRHAGYDDPAFHYPSRMWNLYEDAMRHYRELHDPATHVLLHGDLHHYNILRDGDTWRAIDPKGVIGEPGFDVYAWLKNPFTLTDHYNPEWLLHRRIANLSEILGIERDTLRRWGFIGLVLSALWSVNPELPGGGNDWQREADLAELLRGA